MSVLKQAVEESLTNIRALADFEEPVGQAADMISKCLNRGNKLLMCGNGGSASDATHFATEFLC